MNIPWKEILTFLPYLIKELSVLFKRSRKEEIDAAIKKAIETGDVSDLKRLFSEVRK